MHTLPAMKKLRLTTQTVNKAQVMSLKDTQVMSLKNNGQRSEKKKRIR